MSLKFQNSEHKNNLEKPLWFYRQGLFIYIQFHTSSSRVFISETLELSFQDFTFKFGLASAKKSIQIFARRKNHLKRLVFNKNDWSLLRQINKAVQYIISQCFNLCLFVVSSKDENMLRIMIKKSKTDRTPNYAN